MNNQLLPPSWCVVTLLHCRNLFLHYSSLDCIASYYKSVCHFSIHMRFSQVCFLPSAACRDLSSLVIFSLSPGDTYIHVYYILLGFFGFYFPSSSCKPMLKLQSICAPLWSMSSHFRKVSFEVSLSPYSEIGSAASW